MATAVPKALKGNRHAHGCKSCATRYEDACMTPQVDARCITCRGGRGWSARIEDERPQACCAENSTLATKQQREVYKLAGARLWWRCTVCSRTHPYDPKTYLEDG